MTVSDLLWSGVKMCVKRSDHTISNTKLCQILTCLKWGNVTPKEIMYWTYASGVAKYYQMINSCSATNMPLYMRLHIHVCGAQYMHCQPRACWFKSHFSDSYSRPWTYYDIYTAYEILRIIRCGFRHTEFKESFELLKSTVMVINLNFNVTLAC